MKTRRVTAALAFCSLAIAGCSPGTMVRCALTDLLTAEPGPRPADTRIVAAAAETESWSRGRMCSTRSTSPRPRVMRESDASGFLSSLL